MESRWVGREIKVARKREAVAERRLPELCAKMVSITMYRVDKPCPVLDKNEKS